MRRGITWILILTLLTTISISTVAAELRIEPIRTYPGIAGGRIAEYRYDVINTDTSHWMQVFPLCTSEDAKILPWDPDNPPSYPTQYFTMMDGPDQQAAFIYVESDTPGNKHVTCTLKYIPYKPIEAEDGPNRRFYLKKDGEYADNLTYDDMLTEFLDLVFEATVPFVEGIEDLRCPEDIPLCTVKDIYSAETSNTTYAIIPAIIVILVAAVVVMRRKKR